MHTRHVDRMIYRQHMENQRQSIQPHRHQTPTLHMIIDDNIDEFFPATHYALSIYRMPKYRAFARIMVSFNKPLNNYFLIR